MLALSFLKLLKRIAPPGMAGVQEPPTPTKVSLREIAVPFYPFSLGGRLNPCSNSDGYTPPAVDLTTPRVFNYSVISVLINLPYKAVLSSSVAILFGKPPTEFAPGL